MDICLVTAPIVTEFTDPDELASESVRRTASEPQLGILSLAAVLEQQGYRPRIVDLNRLYLTYASEHTNSVAGFADAAAQLLANCRSDVYGFGSICSSYPLTIRIAQALKAQSKHSVIVLGGPQASVVDVQTLATFPFIDLVLRGEAEQSLPLLLQELQGSQDLGRVPGLTHRGDLYPQRNSNAPIIEDLDLLPFPAYHLNRDLFGANKASLELGRGCPFACTFCSTNDFFRRNFRLRSPESILRDMRTIYAEYSIDDFELVHDMFTVDRRRVMAFCQAMISAGDGFTWSCSARTDCVDEELLEMMARAGCAGIFLGVESGSRRIQEIIHKNLDPARGRQVIDFAERIGVRTTVSLITGFPEETWEDVRDSMNMFMYSARHPHSNPQLGVLAPLAATPIYSKHKGDLELDELCSDVSQQGSQRNEADMQLIRAYPDIFPNFYLVPTPFLGRRSLLELREFVLVGVDYFRWLFTAIHQGGTGILDFYREWREYRERLRSSLTVGDLRRYYRVEFRGDFLRFVRTHQIGLNPIVEALLDYEDRLSHTFTREGEYAATGTPVPAESDLRVDDIVAFGANVRFIELPFDIQKLVNTLKAAAAPSIESGAYYYICLEEHHGMSRLHRVSDWVAFVMRSCSRPRAVGEVLDDLAIQIDELEVEFRTHAVITLLKTAQGNGFISIVRGGTDQRELTRAAAYLQ